MMPEPKVTLPLVPDERLARLESVVAALAQALDGLDALALFTVATHISMGYELARADLEKLQNEVNSR